MVVISSDETPPVLSLVDENVTQTIEATTISYSTYDPGASAYDIDQNGQTINITPIVVVISKL